MSQETELLEWLTRDGLIQPGEARLTPLTGGVSSEICRVDEGTRTFVVKRALPRLKVKGEWQADVARNHSEKCFLEWCGKQIPGSVPSLFHAGKGYFAMEWLGEGYRNWKDMLLDRNSSPSLARRAGEMLGRIHRLSHHDPELCEAFPRIDLFEQLRVSPYLLVTGAAHPELLPLFECAANEVRNRRECLIHGDFSPKNILCRGDRLVLLDAEVAVYGNPAFDLAFLLNHFCLKGLLHALENKSEQEHYHAAISGYFHERKLKTDEMEALNLRVAFLLPMLMLARVDGLSPVEYLHTTQQEQVRQFVYREVGKPASLESLAGAWFGFIGQ